MALIALAALVGAMLGVCACLALLRGRLIRRAAEQAERWREAAIAEETAESLSRSRAVLRGQLVEHLAPIFEVPTFPDPGDARFLGRPVDFIVFDGYGEVRAGRAQYLREIVFVDIKTGTGRLNPVERSIREAVEDGRVRTAVIHRPPGRAG